MREASTMLSPSLPGASGRQHQPECHIQPRRRRINRHADAAGEPHIWLAELQFAAAWGAGSRTGVGDGAESCDTVGIKRVAC